MGRGVVVGGNELRGGGSSPGRGDAYFPWIHPNLSLSRLRACTVFSCHINRSEYWSHWGTATLLLAKHIGSGCEKKAYIILHKKKASASTVIVWNQFTNWMHFMSSVHSFEIAGMADRLLWRAEHAFSMFNDVTSDCLWSRAWLLDLFNNERDILFHHSKAPLHPLVTLVSSVHPKPDYWF